MMNKLFILFIYFSGISMMLAQNPLQDSIPFGSIKKALENNEIDVKVFGAYDSRFYEETIDSDGIHYGKCMLLFLRNKANTPLHLKLESGILMIPLDTSYQKMVVTKNVNYVLNPREELLTRFYAMCGEINKASPSVIAEYEIGDFGDSSIVKIARYFDKNFIQNKIGQHALWAYADQVGIDKLKSYGADSLSLEKTKGILAELNIPHKLVVEAETQVDPEEDSTVNVSILWIYAVVIVFLGMVILFIFLYRKRNA